MTRMAKLDTEALTREPAMADAPGLVGYRAGTWLLPVAAVCGALWSLAVPTFDGGLWLRIALALVAALVQVLVQVLAQEIAAWQSRVLHATAFAVLLGSLAGGVLLALAQVVTHHRPLGAVSVAVVSVGLVVGLALLCWRLGSLRVIRAGSAWVPFVLLGALVLGVGAEARGVVALGVAVALGVRVAATKLLTLRAPRWVDWVLVGLLLGGNVAAWQNTQAIDPGLTLVEFYGWLGLGELSVGGQPLERSDGS
jgi:hypothetical protein